MYILKNFNNCKHDTFHKKCFGYIFSIYIIQWNETINACCLKFLKNQLKTFNMARVSCVMTETCFFLHIRKSLFYKCKRLKMIYVTSSILSARGWQYFWNLRNMHPNFNWGASLRFPNSLEAENNPQIFLNFVLIYLWC